MTIRLLKSDRAHPDMGGNNRGAHLHDGDSNCISAWAPNDAEAKRRLVKVARKFAAEINSWCDKQEAKAK